LNTRIQPSGADILKQKGVELLALAREIGFKMRLTVHDEFDGDVPDLEQARVIAELLNQQSFKLRVPILWETSVGTNWDEQVDVRNLKKSRTKEHVFDLLKKRRKRKLRREDEFGGAHKTDPYRKDYYGQTGMLQKPGRGAK
jgi:hypothetical protein